MRAILIEHILVSDNNRSEAFHLTGVEYTVEGKKIEHRKYCKQCLGIETENGLHEKTDDYPD